jgi:tetratricopeptide (TPR) repeat protein
MASTNHQVLPKDAVERAFGLCESALDLYAKGESRQAETMFRRALRLLERTEGANHPDVASVLNYLAAIHEDRCEYEAAERLYERSVKILGSAVDNCDAELIQLRLQSWVNLGRVHQSQGRNDRAESIFQQTLALSEQAFGGDSAELAESLNQLGGHYKCAGRA